MIFVPLVVKSFGSGLWGVTVKKDKDHNIW